MVTPPQIICLGEILLDCLADQLGQALDSVSSWTAYPGGAPANVACALSKLGNAAAFVGCIGSDKAGDELAALLEKSGVDITGLQRSSHAPTRQVYVTRSLTGDRHFAGFGDYQPDEFADTELAADALPPTLFSQAKFLVLGTLELAYPKSRQATAQALTFARQFQVQRFVDINWRPVFWTDPKAAQPLIVELLNQADFIKCTDEEAHWLFQTQNPVEIAGLFPLVKGVLVTAGERGCAYSLGPFQGIVEAFPAKVMDTTGAGDSFVAGFLHYCCRHQAQILTDAEIARNAVVYGSAVGALTTLKLGAIAAQPSPQDVSDFLQRTLGYSLTV